MIFKSCPICSTPLILPKGHSDLLIIGSAPDDVDIQNGSPFSSSRSSMRKVISAGYILRKELERVGLSINDFRVTHLWLHEPNKSEDCFKIGYDTVLDEAKGKKAILLVGAEATEIFTGYKVSEVSGLQVDSSLLSCPNIMAMVSPALAMSRVVGEVRNGVLKWKNMLDKENFI